MTRNRLLQCVKWLCFKNINYYWQCTLPAFSTRLLLAGVKRELLDTVKARRLAYYGHTMMKQGSCLEKEIIQGRMPGARRRGGWTTSVGGQYSQWKRQSVWQRTKIHGEVHPWCCQPSDWGWLKNRTVRLLLLIQAELLQQRKRLCRLEGSGKAASVNDRFAMWANISAKAVAHERSRKVGSTSSGECLRCVDESILRTSVAWCGSQLWQYQTWVQLMAGNWLSGFMQISSSCLAYAHQLVSKESVESRCQHLTLVTIVKLVSIAVDHIVHHSIVVCIMFCSRYLLCQFCFLYMRAWWNVFFVIGVSKTSSSFPTAPLLSAEARPAVAKIQTSSWRTFTEL